MCAVCFGKCRAGFVSPPAVCGRACPRPADRPSPAAGCRVTAPRGRAQVLDHYLSAQGQPAFNLTHGLDISAQFIGNAARNQGQTKM